MGVGISSKQSYREESLRMTSGDLLLLYTDGLSEARSPSTEMFGETRLAQALARHRHATAWEIVSSLMGEVMEFVGAASQADDIALIVMKATPVVSRETGAPSR
jgi:sigma-B regulation protein RsbU (phosphoserine phosphatase)